jgi:hypothetical protein
MNAQMSSPDTAVDWRTREGWQRTPTRTEARISDPRLPLSRVQPSHLAVAGAITTLLGLVTAAWLIASVGVALLIAAGVMTAARPRTKVMYWRGRRIELTEESSTGRRLHRWLGRP